MVTDFKDHRIATAAYITDFLENHNSSWQNERWSHDVLKRFQSFAPSGKLLRSSLLLQAYSLFTQKPVTPLLPLAAALELMQSSLLIHDDFIDLDDVRRGQPSIPNQYRSIATDEGYSNPDHAGNSLAICAGDIGFFLGFELLGQLELEPGMWSKVVKQFSQEYQLVGLGEMADVHLAMTDQPVTEAEILAVYRSKTARYSLVMPILLAATVAEAEPKLVASLESVAEKIGLVFQIIDDQLGIFGTEAQIGKPVISDVREGKKTLYYYYAMSLAKGEDLAILKQSFGNPNLTVEDMELVKRTLQQCGAVTAVDHKLAQLKSEINTELSALEDPEWQAFINQFLDYNLLRQK